MTIYRVFLTVSQEDRNKIEENIHLSTIVPNVKWFLNNDKWYCLYAWTGSKNVYKQFKSSRKKKYFIYDKIDINGTELEEFRNIHKSKELTYYEFENKVSMMITKYEMESLSDSDTIFGNISSVRSKLEKLIDPLIFDNKLLAALELFSYSRMYYYYSTNLSEEETSYERLDNFSYNSSFDVNELGFRLGNFRIDELFTFLFMYGKLIELKEEKE